MKNGNEQEIPIFTPPKGEYDGAVCYHHPTEQAVARCARCGKYICKDCSEAYGVTSGEYKGKYLCYDCCEQLVSNNIEELTRNKEKIKKQFILSIIGIVIGFIVGFSAAISSNTYGFGLSLLFGLLYAGIGGVFLSALKAFLKLYWESIKVALSTLFSDGLAAALGAIIGGVFFGCIVICFQCIWTTIKNTFYYINYLNRTAGFIESDTAALQQMRDYMQYTLVRNQNKGVDLENLMNEGSELYNNSYAQAVRANGEAAADAALRQATTRIAENGEIIRDFPNAA